MGMFELSTGGEGIWVIVINHLDGMRAWYMGMI